MKVILNISISWRIEYLCCEILLPYKYTLLTCEDLLLFHSFVPLITHLRTLLQFSFSLFSHHLTPGAFPLFKSSRKLFSERARRGWEVRKIRVIFQRDQSFTFACSVCINSSNLEVFPLLHFLCINLGFLTQAKHFSYALISSVISRRMTWCRAFRHKIGNQISLMKCLT